MDRRYYEAEELRFSPEDVSSDESPIISVPPVVIGTSNVENVRIDLSTWFVNLENFEDCEEQLESLQNKETNDTMEKQIPKNT